VIEIRTVGGPAVGPWLGAVAALRIEVFRAWPYLYDGDFDYEAKYLATYARAPHSLFVLALDGEQVIGASTGVPLVDEVEAFRRPFRAAGIDVREVYYFGESVLLPSYRGRGLGHRFFDEREAHARALGRFRWTAFCAVVRAADDPRRPADYRPLDAFWRGRGYRPRSDMVAEIEWQELGERAPSRKPLSFWVRPLD
jgi:GNAT superfamily N-acetyltransferase